VLLTDITAYADAMKEIGVAQEKIPATRGYMGDLYTQLARRYEKACDYSAAAAINRAGQTLRDLRVAEVSQLDMTLKNGKVQTTAPK
jgi:vacuolar-type H+-ATPase catalytic subunit A/Vma1